MNRTVIALIGDIVESRQIEKRETFNTRLSDVLQALNQPHGRLLSPYTVTLGDEIQALFSVAENIFCDTVAIQAAIHPRRMRFSLGVGTLVTPVNTQAAIGMDGPAFYQAREGIEILKKNDELYIINGEIPSMPLINTSLGFVSHLMSNWSLTRLKVLLNLMQGKTVKEIAFTLAISVQAVYKNIHAGGLERVIGLFHCIESAIDISMEK